MKRAEREDIDEVRDNFNELWETVQGAPKSEFFQVYPKVLQPQCRRQRLPQESKHQ